MRRFIFFALMLTGISLFAVSCTERSDVPVSETDIYFADAEMTRLLEYKTDIVDADAEHRAKAVAEKLIEGRDDNDKIRRLIPKKKGCIRVSLDKQTAIVDIESEIADTLPESRDIERLFIYQIVDSLTVRKGIRYVRFTIDGEVKKDFMGYFDMRETYKYRYPE